METKEIYKAVLEMVKQDIHDYHMQTGLLEIYEYNGLFFVVNWKCDLEGRVGMSSDDYDTPNDPNQTFISNLELEFIEVWNDEEINEKLCNELNKL